MEPAVNGRCIALWLISAWSAACSSKSDDATATVQNGSAGKAGAIATGAIAGTGAGAGGGGSTVVVQGGARLAAGAPPSAAGSPAPGGAGTVGSLVAGSTSIAANGGSIVSVLGGASGSYAGAGKAGVAGKGNQGGSNGVAGAGGSNAAAGKAATGGVGTATSKIGTAGAGAAAGRSSASGGTSSGAGGGHVLAGAGGTGGSTSITYLPVDENLPGIWVIGWSGGEDHYSWIRFSPRGSSLGAAVDVLDVTGGGGAWTSYFRCEGQGRWDLPTRPNAISVHLPNGCRSSDISLLFTSIRSTITFGLFSKATLEANVEVTGLDPSGGNPVMAYKYPDTQCDAAMTACQPPN